MRTEIPPRSGVAFTLRKGQRLRVIDPRGEQVSDLIAFNRDDKQEYLSSGRSLDYASRLFLTTGDILYSNRSQPMFLIGEDRVGRHDFLLTPCSAETFSMIYGHEHPHRGCYGNLSEALAPFGIAPDQIPVTFNIFMNVDINGDTGQITVRPPKSNAGDHIDFVAQMDLIVGLTACSAEQSNNYSFKPIEYEVFDN
ncbi:MAG: urea carboxylase-associated family protein [Sulfuriferula multivorans]|uniref:Urea carboxylase-associated family protein n=1 Tax=Sulfuriferula multivorans TaxID=1559896 RepID=A0A7C9P4J8_9PROT|nr:urea carboxylase-associated family protein [Sulfuriferula multivorans]